MTIDNPVDQGCQSTRHMTNSSPSQIVTVESHLQLVTRSTHYTAKSSHSQLVTIRHTYVNTIDYLFMRL